MSPPKPSRVERDLDRIALLAIRLLLATQQLERDYGRVHDASYRHGSSGELPTLGRGFAESDPTGNTAVHPRLSELRWRAREAAGHLEEALAATEEAESLLSSGLTVAFDDREWARWVEKLAARA